MKKFILFVSIFVVLLSSAAFGGATEDLFNGVKNKTITPDRIKALAKFGADVNYKDENGVTVLMTAIINNSNRNVIQALIDAGAEINVDDYDEVFEKEIGKRKLNTDLMKSLVNIGVEAGFVKDVNKKCKYYNVPFFIIAAGFLEYDNMKKVIDAGANFNESVQEGGMFINSGLMTLASAVAYQDNPKVITLLAQSGIDVNAKAPQGITALMLALANNKNININPANVKALIEAGADVLAKDDTGKTAYDYAQTDELRNIILDAVK